MGFNTFSVLKSKALIALSTSSCQSVIIFAAGADESAFTIIQEDESFRTFSANSFKELGTVRVRNTLLSFFACVSTQLK